VHKESLNIHDFEDGSFGLRKVETEIVYIFTVSLLQCAFKTHSFVSVSYTLMWDQNRKLKCQITGRKAMLVVLLTTPNTKSTKSSFSQASQTISTPKGYKKSLR